MRDEARMGTIALWSAKGGVGTTVCAVALSILLGHRDREALLVDLAGDAPMVMAMPEPDGPGAIDWLAADDAVPFESIERLHRAITEGMAIVHRGRDVAPRMSRVGALLTGLATQVGPVVIDAGVIPPSVRHDMGAGVRRALVEGADRSLLVTRSCYVAIRRAKALDLRLDGVVLIEEPHRALGRTDVADVLGAPVVAAVPIDPAIARAVDSGLLVARLPTELRRGLAHVAD